MVATAPGEKLLIERRPVRNWTELQFFFFVSTITAATRAALFDFNMHQIVCRLGLRPIPHWRSLQRSPDSLAVFRGATSKGKGGEKEGKGGEERKGRRRKGKGKGERRKGDGTEGMEFVLCPWEKKSHTIRYDTRCAVALLLQDHLTMSVTEQSQYLSETVQRERKTCPGVNPRGNTP